MRGGAGSRDTHRIPICGVAWALVIHTVYRYAGWRGLSWYTLYIGNFVKEKKKKISLFFSFIYILHFENLFLLYLLSISRLKRGKSYFAEFKGKKCRVLTCCDSRLYYVVSEKTYLQWRISFSLAVKYFFQYWVLAICWRSDSLLFYLFKYLIALLLLVSCDMCTEQHSLYTPQLSIILWWFRSKHILKFERCRCISARRSLCGNSRALL